MAKKPIDEGDVDARGQLCQRVLMLDRIPSILRHGCGIEQYINGAVREYDGAVIGLRRGRWAWLSGPGKKALACAMGQHGNYDQCD